MMSANFLKMTMIATAVIGAGFATAAAAQEKVAVGQLTCGVKGGMSFVFGSTRELRCVFNKNPSDDGERYEGSIQKYGLDLGYTGNALMTWTVLAPTRGVRVGELGGKYYGVAADASAGVGGGANVLVGGSNNTISLQPVSVQGQTGLNAAVAVAEVELHPSFEK
jgi:Protein of unknown function (DUF992)